MSRSTSSPRRLRSRSCLLGFCLSWVATTAEAQPKPSHFPESTEFPGPLEWTWRTTGPWDFALIGLGAGLGLGLGFATPLTRRSGIGTSLDETVRDSLRASNEVTRERLAFFSDLQVGIAWAYPAVDAGYATWGRRSPRVGWELVVISAQTAALTTGVVSTAKFLIGRERPYGRTCETNPPIDRTLCEPRHRYVSFVSGHTAHTVAAATAGCISRHRLHLYENRQLELLGCLAGFGLALGTATERIVSDRHYVTDVLAGAALGASIGWATASGLRYEVELDEARLALIPSPTGARVLGWF